MKILSKRDVNFYLNDLLLDFRKLVFNLKFMYYLRIWKNVLFNKYAKEEYANGGNNVESSQKI